MSEARKRKYEKRPCEDCGKPMKVHPAAKARQKYCGLCRLARQMQWHDLRTETCGCGRKYVAWGGKRSAKVCGVCYQKAAPLGVRESVQGECGWHKMGLCHSDTETQTLFHERVRCCLPCLDDPAKAAANRRTVLQRHAELTAAKNGGTMGEDNSTPPEDR